MSIQVGCEGCGKIYTVDDRFAGKKAKCKTCGAVMTVPGAAKPASASASRSPAGVARKVSSSSSSSQRPAGSSAARPAARKPVAVEAKPDPGDFDLSALDAIENSGEVDHDYVAPMPVAAPRADAATTASRPKGTVYRPTAAVTKVGGRQVAAANVPTTFWESLKPGPAGYVFLGVLLIGAMCVASAKASAYAALGFGVVGIIFIVLSKIMMSSMASNEGFTTYLMYRFVPFYAFYYFVSRWQDTQKATSMWLKGAAMFLLALALMIRAGGEFAGALGTFYRPARTQTAANTGGQNSNNSGSGTTSKEDDPDHDDLDDNPSLNLAQKIAIRRARARQKEMDALGLHAVEKLTLKAQTEFPPLPDKGNGDGLDEYGITLHEDFLAEPMAMVMWMPEGNHPPHSLACVFVPPMGSPEFTGITRHERDEKFKLLAKQGFVVVSYDCSRFSDNNRPQMQGTNEEELIQSDCGVQFAQNAINFVLQRAPMVDPERLYAAGAGGSARLVLYLAIVDPRIKAVATSDPVCDLTRNPAMLKELEKETRLAGLPEFAKQTSPTQRVEDLKCPVLVVTSHAPAGAGGGGGHGFGRFLGFGGGGGSGDSESDNMPGGAADVSAFIEAMKKLGRPITVEPPIKPADNGGEAALQAMFDQWAKWLKNPPKSAPTTSATTKPVAG